MPVATAWWSRPLQARPPKPVHRRADPAVRGQRHRPVAYLPPFADFRPLVVAGDSPSRCSVRQANEGTTLVVDGQVSVPLKAGDRVTDRPIRTPVPARPQPHPDAMVHAHREAQVGTVESGAGLRTQAGSRRTCPSDQHRPAARTARSARQTNHNAACFRAAAKSPGTETRRSSSRFGRFSSSFRGCPIYRKHFHRIFAVFAVFPLDEWGQSIIFAAEYTGRRVGPKSANTRRIQMAAGRMSKSAIASALAEQGRHLQEAGRAVHGRAGQPGLRQAKNGFVLPGLGKLVLGQPQGPHGPQPRDRRSDQDPGQEGCEVPRGQGRQGRDPGQRCTQKAKKAAPKKGQEEVSCSCSAAADAVRDVRHS